MQRQFHILDVFTDTPFTGNGLAVVMDADGLDGTRMQAIAREFNLSETVFVLKPQQPAHTARVRIFTPAKEMPFAGHPTVGTAALLAELKASAAQADGDALVVLEEEIGIVRVGVRLRAGAAPYAEFDAPRLPEDGGTAPAADDLAAALGLIPAEIGFENHRPSRYSAGNSFVFVPVASLEAIGKAQVAPQHWANRHAPAGTHGRLPLLPADRAHDVGVPCAHVRPRLRRAGGPGDGLGGSGLRRRRASLRCAARRQPQAQPSSRATRWDGRA